MLLNFDPFSITFLIVISSACLCAFTLAQHRSEAPSTFAMPCDYELSSFWWQLSSSYTDACATPRIYQNLMSGNYSFVVEFYDNGMEVNNRC
jgi:hypothetical protein